MSDDEPCLCETNGLGFIIRHSADCPWPGHPQQTNNPSLAYLETRNAELRADRARRRAEFEAAQMDCAYGEFHPVSGRLQWGVQAPFRIQRLFVWGRRLTVLSLSVGAVRQVLHSLPVAAFQTEWSVLQFASEVLGLATLPELLLHHEVTHPLALSLLPRQDAPLLTDLGVPTANVSQQIELEVEGELQAVVLTGRALRVELPHPPPGSGTLTGGVTLDELYRQEARLLQKARWHDGGGTATGEGFELQLQAARVRNLIRLVEQEQDYWRSVAR